MKQQIKSDKPAKVELKAPSKSIEREFAEAMESMISKMSSQFKNQAIKGLHKSTVEKFSDAQAGNYAKVFLALSKNVSKSLVKRYDDKRIDELAKRYLERANQENRNNLYSAIGKKVGIDPQQLIATEGLKANTNALILETAQWAKKLRDDTLEEYTANSLRIMSQGGTIEDVMNEYDAMTEKRKNHAKFTARNQIGNFNAIMGKVRVQNLGITKGIWRTAKDERVRPCHAARDGKEFDLSEGLYSSCDGKTLLAGTDFQCFPGESKLNNTSLCKKLFRRWFTGELTEIVTSDGIILRCTPNHPIFTRDGIKPAKLINSSDYLIKTDDETGDIIELYGYDPIPTFEQIFSTLDFLGVEHGISASIGSEFHGDITDGEIDIIGLDSLLVNEINPIVREKFLKLNLSKTDEMVVLDFFTCLGNGFFTSFASNASKSGFMRIFDLVMSSFIGHLSPFELFAFSLGSWHESSFYNSISYDVPRDTEKFRDSIFAFSVLIHGRDIFNRKIMFDTSMFRGVKPNLIKMRNKSAIIDSKLNSDIFSGTSINYLFDSVISVKSNSFSGHVYNLETISNDYITQTATVSNCRCTTEYIIPTDED